METDRSDGLAPIAYLPGARLAGADEATLASGLCGGDPRALREVWRRFQPMVLRIAIHGTGAPSAAHALTRRVFAALLDRLDRDDTNPELTPLLLSIVAREVRRAVRRSRARRWLGLRVIDVLDLTTLHPDPFAQQSLVRFFVLLDRLGPLDRTAFSLRFFERRELDEVAAALDLTPAVTERRLARAWKLLARAVRDDAALADLLPTLAIDEEEDDELQA